MLSNALCCGDTPYGLAERGVLCCKNVLYKDREDEEECSESGVPYKPFKETVCVSKRHNSPGGHCCGEDLYHPNKTICCKGHRYNRAIHIRCCGVQAYSIFDPLQKCCEGTLYNLTSEEVDDMQCCGSVLLNVTNQDVCCTSEDKSLFYPARKGFQCCGHHYYNPALWSCCAGKLSPVHKKIYPTSHSTKESKLQLLSNLNKTQLCNEIFIGIVESVSRGSTVFSNVLKIKGNNATVEPNVFILETPDQCKFLGLTTAAFLIPLFIGPPPPNPVHPPPPAAPTPNKTWIILSPCSPVSPSSRTHGYTTTWSLHLRLVDSTITPIRIPVPVPHYSMPSDK
ncbi:hypothetical protein CRENBAI_021794 [Crenichthys baileyi]|uniref:Galaxin-like repeats domain-containing protein n=1 Tax=Crenichthys baileyi TaxID=28760 RepID=A0AAV9SHT7_9TELE